MTPANDRTSVGSGSAEWRTPTDLFARLDRRYAFDFDAFASHDNALTPQYATAGGTFAGVTAGALSQRVKLYEEDGLRVSWRDRRVFMNPPYTRGFVGLAVAKACAERDEAAIIVALLPANTDTRWFHESIRPHAEVEFLRRRVRYIDPTTGKPGASPPGGSMVVVWRSELMP